MGRTFNVATRFKTAPNIQSMAYAAGQVFLKGALLTVNAAGELIECGADPASVYAVAAEGAGTKPGYDLANSSVTTVVTGRVQEASVYVIDRDMVFSCRAVNGGTDPVLPLQTHVDEQYGVAKVGNDWVVDMAETTAKVVEIVDYDVSTTGLNLFLVKFLESVIGRP
jgi:hypothetical protein